MNTLKISPPVYLLEAASECWKCFREIQVVALACLSAVERIDDSKEFEDISEDGEPLLLSYIEEMPSALLEQIVRVQPSYSRQSSLTAGMAYYANSCPHCNALIGDHYLQSEPEGAFLPISDEAFSAISIRDLKWVGDLEVRGCYGVGVGREIFDKGRRI